jgi:hypothetical protein
MFQVRPFSQIDPHWKDKKLGGGTSDKATIGYAGCLLTCMTMVANGFGAGETPATLNDRLAAIGGFAGIAVKTYTLGKLYPKIVHKKRIPVNKPPAPLNEIDAHLAAGFPVIVKIDYSPQEADVQDHWIVLLDKQGDDYLVQDPHPIRNELKPVLLSATPYGKGARPQDVILDIILYEGPVQARGSGSAPAGSSTARIQPAEEARSPAPENAMLVLASVDQLALRKKPKIDKKNLKARLPRGSRLTVLEPGGQARRKVGKANTWLEVRTEAGEQGYVAAWLVRPAQETAPAERTDTVQPEAGQPMVVYSTADGRLALRRQPMKLEANVICWAPHGSEFAVLEPVRLALAKIGVEGQWLKVRDILGNQGYVAAWYVSAARQEPALGVRLVSLQPAAKPPADGPGGELVVRAIAEGLVLRQEPDSGGAAVQKAPLHAELLVLEPAGEAIEKIGAEGQWLKVRDIQGCEGFVAAGEVVKRPAAVIL